MGSPELQQGALELLILRVLRSGELHGWAIARRIHDLSQSVLTVGQGSLYPALYRLEDRELISSEWGISPEGRKAKFYRLTAEGQRRLTAERSAWERYAGAINLVLRDA